MQRVESVQELEGGTRTSEDDEEIPDPLTQSVESVEESPTNEAVIKFDQLCSTTNDLFSRIQRLSPYISDPSRWKQHFFHAFSQFDQLWRYQQEQRETLDLMRSQIGEIGSKIAQLYLAYYLRTSQARFVREAFAFYDAILKRDYFEWQSQSGSNRLTLVGKKLRLLSRAVQVSMFLEDFRSAQEILTRLTEFVERESGEKRGEGIPEEFHQVPSELDLFLSTLCLPFQEDTPDYISPFHTLPTSFLSRRDTAGFCLGPIILVGGNHTHFRLLDFTIDHYMMFCFLKRVCLTEDGDGPIIVHFHRLSTFSLLETLASLCDSLPPAHVMLLYLSAKSLTSHSPPANSILLPEPGGLSARSIPAYSQQLLIGDLYPFLRKPLLLLLDSPGFSTDPDSLSFPSTFRQPLICLAAPSHYPCTIENHLERGGGLLTLFLCSPLLGLRLICGIQSLTAKLAHKASALISRVEDIGFSEFSSLPNLPLAYTQLCTDRTIQYVIKRYLFFWCCLRLHLGFKREHHPTCYPVINSALFHSSSLLVEYFELFAFLDVLGMFMDMPHAMDL